MFHNINYYKFFRIVKYVAKFKSKAEWLEEPSQINHSGNYERITWKVKQV